MDSMPLTDWEDELGRLLAHRLRTRAKEALSSGLWSLGDLDVAVASAERRLTERQRLLLWHVLTTDRELAELARG